jgi:hypothetical protein
MGTSSSPTGLDEIDRIVQGHVFFVVGAARSGTTWLQLCLDGHPEISCRGEGHFIEIFGRELARAMNDYDRRIKARNIASLGKPDAFRVFNQRDFHALLSCAIALLLDKNRGGKSCKWLGEKTPDNVLHMHMLAKLFPHCRFIHIIRDGRDAAVSAWLNSLRIDERQTRTKFGNLAGFVSKFSQSWSKKIQTARQFGSEYQDRYRELFYEDLHRRFEPTLKGVFEYLDVDASDEAIEQCRQAGLFSKHSGQRAPGEEDKTSHFRKGEIGDWKNHFDDAARRAFMEQAGGMLEELGYV